MSDEPRKVTGAAFGHGPIQGEKAEIPEQLVEHPDAEAEVAVEAAAEPEVEEPKVTEEPAVDEDEGERLVREVTERLAGQAADEPVPPVSSDTSRLEGRIEELKDQIRQMGKAQQQPEPEGGFDFSLLEDPEVLAHYEAAKDDPAALARMQGVIAQKVLEAQGDRGQKALEGKVDTLLQALQQQQRVQYNRQVFEAGLDAAQNLGSVEAALVKQFNENRELAHLDAHMRSGGKAEEYQPKSVLGLWLMGRDPVTKQPNAVFAGNPTLMQAGVKHLADQLKGGATRNVEGISTTGAAAPVKAGSSDSETDEEMSPEDQIKQAIVAASAASKRPAAFR